MNSYFIRFPFSRDTNDDGVLWVEKIKFTILEGVFYYPGIQDQLPIGEIEINFSQGAVPLFENDLFPLLQGNGTITDMGAFGTPPQEFHSINLQ